MGPLNNAGWSIIPVPQQGGLWDTLLPLNVSLHWTFNMQYLKKKKKAHITVYHRCVHHCINTFLDTPKAQGLVYYYSKGTNDDEIKILRVTRGPFYCSHITFSGLEQIMETWWSLTLWCRFFKTGLTLISQANQLILTSKASWFPTLMEFHTHSSIKWLC